MIDFSLSYDDVLLVPGHADFTPMSFRAQKIGETSHAHQIATGDDFFRLLGEYTQVDLSPLLDKYFYNR